MNLRMVLAGAGLWCAAGAGGGEPPRDEFIFLPVTHRPDEGSEWVTDILVNRPDGTSVAKVTGREMCRLRATSRGTALVVDYSGRFLELSPKGDVLWDYRWPDQEKLFLGAADIAPGGHLFLVIALDAGPSKQGAEKMESQEEENEEEEDEDLFCGRNPDQTRPVAILEVDRVGKEIRRFQIDHARIPSGIASIRWAGEGRVLVATNADGVFEVDERGRLWNLPLPKEFSCAEAVKLSNGNYLLAAQNSVLEVTKDGKEVWSVPHNCPSSVQPLAEGHVLAGGG